MQKLYEKHAESGFEILAFPCNQFGGQEPEPVETILKQTADKFGRSFPLQGKIEVHGSDADPLYKMLDPKESLITWNFGKFLVDDEGKVTGYYAPKISPLGMEDDIVSLLNHK